MVILLMEEILHTWHVWSPANSGIFTISTGAGCFPSTVHNSTLSQKISTIFPKLSMMGWLPDLSLIGLLIYKHLWTTVSIEDIEGFGLVPIKAPATLGKVVIFGIHLLKRPPCTLRKCLTNGCPKRLCSKAVTFSKRIMFGIYLEFLGSV